MGEEDSARFLDYFAIFLARISGIFVNNPPPKPLRTSLHGRMGSVNGANTEDRGAQGADGGARRRTLTPPVKWVDLKQFVHDGIATGEAWDSDSRREVPQEHRSQSPASAGPNSGWTMLGHVSVAKPGISRVVLGSSDSHRSHKAIIPGATSLRQ